MGFCVVNRFAKAADGRRGSPLVSKLEFGMEMLCPACLRFGDEQLGDAIGAEASAAWLRTKLELRG